ncbi:MAG: thiamine-phosphate kinase [Bacteroidales bacterium]
MPGNKKKLTPISDLGEFGLIRQLTRNIKVKHKTTILGVGDDAAILGTGKKKMLLTTDLLTEGIHFNLVYTPLKHLGYKSVVVNLSDIYAMNGIPSQITVSIAISAKFAVEHIEEIYEGISLACDKYNVDLVGGDSTSSLTGLTISVTALGEAPEKTITCRNTSKPNDLICVSGDLGAAYLGLQILEREKKIFMESEGIQPRLEGYDYVIQRQLKPEARGDIVQLLNEKEIVPTAMIDVSDGLSSDLLHVCSQSGTGCKIYQEKIPVAKDAEKVANELHIDPVTCALNGGEDYELLFTINQNDYDKIKEDKKIKVIGHMTPRDQSVNIITLEGNVIPIRAQGWNPLQ